MTLPAWLDNLIPFICFACGIVMGQMMKQKDDDRDV